MTDRKAGDLSLARDLAQAAAGAGDWLRAEPVDLLVKALVIAAGQGRASDRKLESAVRKINDARAKRFAARRARRRTA